MSWSITIICAVCGEETDNSFENNQDYPMEKFECVCCRRVMDHMGNDPWKPTEARE